MDQVGAFLVDQFVCFRQEVVPCFVTCTPKEGITSMVLGDMLKRMENVDLFPPKLGGQLPFLLLNEHNSNFQLHFLEYVNNQQYCLVVYIGLPNRIAFW